MQPTEQSSEGSTGFHRQRRRRRWGRGNKPRRGFPLFIIPNLFTTGNLFCGFFSILKAVQGDYLSSAYLILAAAVFDLVDGRVARLTHTTTQFGMEYDSLSDVVSFGMAPALLMYYWSLQPFGRLGWLIGFLYLACGALRLARFNVYAITGQNEKGYFKGLPIPMAALTVASSVLFHEELGWVGYRSLFILLCTFFVAYMMVSNVRFRSYKDFDLKEQHGFSKLVLVVVLLIAIAAKPEIMLFACVSTFLVIHVFMHVWRVLFRRTAKPSEEVQEPPVPRGYQP